MTTMTPALLLAGFCAVLSLLAAGRLVVDDEADQVDLGSAVVILGITLLATFWATYQEGLLSTELQLLLGLFGIGTVAVGVGVIVRYWHDTTPIRQSNSGRSRSENEDRDGGSDDLQSD
ncbi:uncharacterized protein Nmag_2940 [Natrialba magadii ATCC 43099]|uniref:Uncharacterized protein n=1 Tax=Natrialba magadii (strain ATCC 43099 / DSM 3394 / CCM 3739 / CIP 104546 / IAM 13178 / JCM 8861 / NBRC 102185 / NCIMB 2190 / MS3) TaxID=547559 RepID=D3T0L3_NATMM|nr:hypothetical protein [Natrialba magadii]ADD06492.1 uncharacterized protein Nmag_2940 [Natrialba magadii ATCC 43099]ELY32045.1 hypothetical protein C500_05688 [Natrialba magadii ATCC 43099]